MRNLLKSFILLPCVLVCQQSLCAQPEITWDSRSIMVNGRRVAPVMGEIHYSRIPTNEWASEVKKIKEGGVTIIATYVFWNHIEEIENQFDWSGQRNLRRFLEICKRNKCL